MERKNNATINIRNGRDLNGGSWEQIYHIIFVPSRSRTGDENETGTGRDGKGKRWEWEKLVNKRMIIGGILARRHAWLDEPESMFNHARMTAPISPEGGHQTEFLQPAFTGGDHWAE